MKKVIVYLILALFTVKPTFAQYMVHEENYFNETLIYTGLPDYPPFSSYKVISSGVRTVYTLESAFLEVIKKTAKEYGFKIKSPGEGQVELKKAILDVRSGAMHIFFGAYSNTKMFKGMDLIQPASVSNPIHLITLPENKDKIKSTKDLPSFKGAISKTEYLSDFVMRKIKPLNLLYVETPEEAYEKLFTGEVDYLIGGLYYNKIMASRVGIERYLSFSHNPLFKIPVFVALSKLTPLHSQYMKALEAEFSKPEFATAVKKEILRMVEEEITQNIGVVPPAFTQKVAEEVSAEATQEQTEEETKPEGGNIIEKEVKQKTIDEVLEGI